MDFVAPLGDLLKEVGKGGGGSTEEPTLCLSLVPVAVGVLLVVSAKIRAAWRKDGRFGLRRSERKVQTA